VIVYGGLVLPGLGLPAPLGRAALLAVLAGAGFPYLYERGRLAVAFVQGLVAAALVELGALYLDARRFADARAALDRVPPSHAGYPMALFKRAQVSVLLNEPDRAERIARARQHADATTAPLVARERLFKDVPAR